MKNFDILLDAIHLQEQYFGLNRDNELMVTDLMVKLTSSTDNFHWGIRILYLKKSKIGNFGRI